MNKHTILIALIPLLTFTCSGQEFKEYSNGLIYNDTTMKELRFIVDSMNLKYKKCDPYKDYYSLQQAICNIVIVDTGNVVAARKDIEGNIRFEDFCKKYPLANVTKQILVLKDKSTGYYDKKRFVYFSTVELENDYGHRIESKDTTFYDKELTGKWIFEYSPKSKYSNESLKAFYFESNFNNIKLTDEYARMIQYADCMIDTNSTILAGNANDSYRSSFPGKNRKGKTPLNNKLNAYIAKNTFMPDKKKYTVDSLYYNDYYRWLQTKDSLIDILPDKKEFLSLLKDAVGESIKIGQSGDEIEYLAEKYDKKEHALQLKRERIVVGGCSQDSRPRYHALSIARLSAETVNWDIFLRAHLDIMNDRFSRVSDGSYAYASRNTYIKELESLDFDVTTLILGISLRIENPSGNHYFGSIGRLGRALSESSYKKEIENKMAEMIKDRQLDDYNRVLIYYLFSNYVYNLKESDNKKERIDLLRKAVTAFPDYLSKRIDIKDSDYHHK